MTQDQNCGNCNHFAKRAGREWGICGYFNSNPMPDSIKDAALSVIVEFGESCICHKPVAEEAEKGEG